MQSKRNWYDVSFTLCVVGMIQALVLLPVAIIAYTGGSAVDPDSPGFSMLHNFLSDLGRTVAYSGNSNLISSLIFNASLFLTGALMIPYFIALPKIFQGTREPLWFSILGSVIGVIFALTFIGGALTPSDLYMETHLMFGALAFVSGLPIVVFHTFAILGFPSYPNRYALVYLALGIILSLFLYAMFQAGSTELSLTVTIGQKFVVVSIMLCFLLQSLAGRNIVRTSNE
ncbi:MAG: hypothetical protein ACTSV2_11810 [Candidatus Thorarchaeota archaeon]